MRLLVERWVPATWLTIDERSRGIKPLTRRSKVKETEEEGEEEGKDQQERLARRDSNEDERPAAGAFL